jgi:hypothetical protein
MSDEAMNDETPDVMPRVRPRFRKFAIAAFIVLIPIALFALWDYIEARRLGAAVKALREAKQPLTTQSSYTDAIRPDNASRYYNAASSLVDLSDTYGPPPGLMERLDRGEPGSAELLAEVRGVLERNREAEALLQRATNLDFHGMRPGFEYTLRWGQLGELSRLAGLRTYERIKSGDPDGAAQAIVQNLRLVHPLSWNNRANAVDALSVWSSSAANQGMRALPQLLELNPSMMTLDRLSREVSALDVDDAIEQSVVLERALLVQTFWNEPHQWYARPWRNTVPQPWWQLMRPWLAHRAVALIGIMNEQHNVARRAWPDRLGENAGPVPKPRRWIVGGVMVGLYSDEVVRYQQAERVASIARRLALTRAASLLLAVEQYRRAHGGSPPEALAQLVPQYLPALPVDPYSGQELRYRRDDARVAVYSVGVNRKDDGGEKLDEGPSRRWGIYRQDEPPPDIGLMMRLSGGSAQR